MSDAKSFECQVKGSVKLEDGSYRHALLVPGWTFAECVKATDAFCSLELNYGDRVTFDRVQIGDTISWVFKLDNIEIGRFVIAPKRDSFSWVQKYTSNTRNQGEMDAKRAILFYDIMDDLEIYYYEYLGICDKPAIRPARPKFWHEHAKQAETEKPELPTPTTQAPNFDIRVEGDFNGNITIGDNNNSTNTTK